jgi:RND family efflux transporter MFP subunit
LLLAGWLASPADEPAEKPAEVVVVRPAVKELTDHEDFTGRTDASSHVELRARATGYLTKVNVKEGVQVKQGDVLFEIDSRPYQAQFDQAKTQVDLARAQLNLAEKTLARLEALIKKVPGSVSEQELEQARGAVVEAKARVVAQEASLETCKLNLEFTKVIAPINGRLGRHRLTPGNLVKADETILADLVAVDPIYVYFDIDERTYLRIRKLADDGKLKDHKLPIAVGLANDEESFPHQSVVDFTDNSVDAKTGTIRIRAPLTNKDGRLLPGMFVRGRLALGEPHKALLIPSQAVMTDEGQKFVFVVNDKNVIERRAIVLGQEDQGRRVVSKGLTADDRVVVQGLPRLRPGMVVRPRLVPNEEKQKSGQGESGRSRLSVSRGALGISGGKAILVEADYPGANAQVVSDTVRAPIEQQINGLEKLRMLRSRCTSDGKYIADLSFLRGADLSTIQVLTQNRVSLAIPVIPVVVQNAGMTIRKGASSVLMIVNLTSADNRYDRLYLSNYATIQIKDELSRVDGVSSVGLLGQRDYSMRIWLDPEKLSASNLTAADVLTALRAQNLQVVGQSEQPPMPRLTISTLGRLTDPDEFGGIILKTTRESRTVRLKDVARVELGADTSESLVAFDGKPAAMLVVALTGEAAVRKVRASLKARLVEINERLPKGLDLDLTFDFTANLQNPDAQTTPEYLLLDVDLPSGASAERVEKVLSHSTELLRQTAGVQHVLAMTENPFDLFGNGPCLLVRLSDSAERKTSREAMIQAIRKRLDTIMEMTVRVRDLSGAGGFPRCGYPIDFALRGPELDRIREWAKMLSERLVQNKKLSDVWVSRASALQSQLFIEVDRQRATTMGVDVQDIFNTLQVWLGGQSVSEFDRFGRTWSVRVQAEGGRERVKDFGKLQVRNKDGQMVPLRVLATLKEVAGPTVLDFLDSLPMLEITANRGAGVTADEVRKLCEAQAEEVRKELNLSAEYRLTWLHKIGGTK